MFNETLQGDPMKIIPIMPVKQTVNFGTLLGTFGKAIAGAVSVNFSVSGGEHCDDSCELKNSGCYACVSQKVKPSIYINLERKQNSKSEYLQQLASAKSIKKMVSATWVRFSTFGSIYAPSALSQADNENLRTIAKALDHTKVHFPVETIEKGLHMNTLGFKTRVSANTNVSRLTEILSHGLNASVVIQGDKMARGKNKRLHSSKAFAYMRELNSQGISAKVCPAIAGNAKCGQCTLCANESIKVIVYPMH